MGIKGIYKEIGPGKRISLCKLAVDHLEQTGRPLRLAIDFAIWSFQAQAARGGANPAIRTLFYRLVRLLSLSIIPLFVFDGPNKPLFKRNKRSRGPGDNVSVAMAKRLIKHFGFHMHDAPGEAEAECALLQQQGVVDAVLSEDVDTIMFGCTLTLRNWSAEGSRTAKTPTHVSAYDVSELKQGETGLDREGMVLVALMSGGDYIPEGVPGCGAKIACEAAKAGFGRSLCRIKRSDPEALARWREELAEELRTNKSKFFRTRHKALTIPEEFPNMEVLRYYTHPVVSQAATVDEIKRRFPEKKEIDIAGLRAFTAETFDWVCKGGAIKFIKVLASGMLVQAVMNLSYEELESDCPDVRQEVEARLVKSIKSRRTHFSTDATPELRLSYIPNDIVGVNLDAEEDGLVLIYGRSGLALNSDDEMEEQAEDAESGPKKVFDPLQPDLAWVPETVAKLGVPLTVEDWEENQRKKQRGTAKKRPVKVPRKKASGMLVGALDKYVKSTKPGASASMKEPEGATLLLASSQTSSLLPPLSQQACNMSLNAVVTGSEARLSSSAKHSRPDCSQNTRAKRKAELPRASLDVNPWTIASSQSTPQASMFGTAKEPVAVPQAILISSSPVVPTSPQCMGIVENAQSPTLLPGLDNTQGLSHSSYDHFCLGSSPSARRSIRGTLLSPRDPIRSSDEPCRRPAAKHTQKHNGAAAVRSGTSARRSTRSRRTLDTTAQASIKTFGKLSKAMAKDDMVSGSKASHEGPASDSDDELEELRELGSRVTSQGARDVLPSPRRSSFNTLLGQEEKSGASLTRSHGTQAQIIEIHSSPPSRSPLEAVPAKSEMTTLYMSETSDADHGYLRELEVSRDAANRMMAEQTEGMNGRRGGRGIWRQSEMSFFDLTGED